MIGKAWVLDSFYDWWMDVNGYDFGYRWITTVDVIWHDVNIRDESIWCCEMLITTFDDGTRQIISFGAPRYSLEFIPPYMLGTDYLESIP